MASLVCLSPCARATSLGRATLPPRPQRRTGRRTPRACPATANTRARTYIHSSRSADQWEFSISGSISIWLFTRGLHRCYYRTPFCFVAGLIRRSLPFFVPHDMVTTCWFVQSAVEPSLFSCACGAASIHPIYNLQGSRLAILQCLSPANREGRRSAAFSITHARATNITRPLPTATTTATTKNNHGKTYHAPTTTTCRRNPIQSELKSQARGLDHQAPTHLRHGVRHAVPHEQDPAARGRFVQTLRGAEDGSVHARQRRLHARQLHGVLMRRGENSRK